MTDQPTTDRLAETANPHVFRLWEELGTGLMEVECEAPECDWKATFNPPITAEMKAQAIRVQREHRESFALLSLVDSLQARLDTAERGVLAEITAEQAAQHAKFGEQNHPDGTGPYVKNPDRMSNMEDQSAVARLDCQEAAKTGSLNWMLILREEVYEAFAEVDPAALRAELVQVAAVAVTWVEAIDRRGEGVSQ
jgi:hypothetical protein